MLHLYWPDADNSTQVLPKYGSLETYKNNNPFVALIGRCRGCFIVFSARKQLSTLLLNIINHTLCNYMTSKTVLQKII